MIQAEELALNGGPKAVKSDYSELWPDIGEEEIAAVTSLLREAKLSGYDVIKALESEFAAYEGVEHALAVNNGTAAIHCGLFALGVGPGDEVLVPTYTWLASATPIVTLGAVPVFCDIDAKTLTIDPEDAARRITPRTKAIVAVHMWGHPADMDALLELGKKHGIAILEDCSHAHGGSYKGRRIGTIGEIGAFSLQASKAMIAGEGGLMVTANKEYWLRALCLSDHGRIGHLEDEQYRQYAGTGLGFKYRIHVLAAALAREQLKKLDATVQHRGDNLRYLSEKLEGIEGIEPMYTAPDVNRGGWYGYRAQYKPEDLGGTPIGQYLEALQAEGVWALDERYPLLHQQPFFRQRNEYGAGYPMRGWPSTGGAAPESLPVAEDVQPRLIALPTFTTPQARPVIDEYAAAFRKVSAYCAR